MSAVDAERASNPGEDLDDGFDHGGSFASPSGTGRAERLTYRERRARRAERLRGWADKRERDAGAVLASHEVYRGDHAFNFQPGHIPERARVIRQSKRAFESLDKAQSMSSRAATIEAQAERAIYDDDPDVAERLRERIAELEAERGAIRARGRGACPPYVLKNLSANIRRNRQRLEAVEKEES